MKKIALIPARSGSKRIPKKNLLMLRGHPLIAYTIYAAIQANIFDRVVVSTDSEEIAEVALSYGAEVPNIRPPAFALDGSPDIEWLSLAINEWLQLDDEDLISILRPSNPLRSSETIRNAFEVFISADDLDALRAVRRVKEHPYKMWVDVENNLITPLYPHINKHSKVEAHSTPTQLLGEVYVQDASLEIVKVWVLRRLNSLTGTKTLKYQMPNYEGFDLNYGEDIKYLNHLIETNTVQLPGISKIVKK